MGRPKTLERQKKVFTQRKSCRGCGSEMLVHVLSLGDQYIVAFPKEQDTRLPRAPLTLVRCGLCGLLQLLHTVDRDLMYSDYWYRSSINQTMKDALRDIALAGSDIVYEGRWLDIGANDGCLLSYVPDTFERVACEPAKTFRAQLEEFADKVIPTYFAAGAVEGEFDVITSAAMFYDVDDPERFCRDIASVLTKQGVWINQFSDAPGMVRANAFDSICHEHVCYYSLKDIETIYRRAGLKIFKVSHNDVNGGSARVFAQREDGPFHSHDMHGFPSVTPSQADDFARRIAKWKDTFKDCLNGDRLKYAPIWCYGASTKGSTLLQYLDCNDKFIGVADRNPDKVGRMMVGSWIPITDEPTMRRAKPRCMVVLPWAFRREFVEREEATRADGATLLFPLPNPEFVL